MIAEFGDCSGTSRLTPAAGARTAVPGGRRRAGGALSILRPEAAPDHIPPRTRRASLARDRGDPIAAIEVSGARMSNPFSRSSTMT